MKAKCGNCKFYLGCGDWNLCCSNPPKDEIDCFGFLCYADTDACKNYKYKGEGDANEVENSVS